MNPKLVGAAALESGERDEETEDHHLLFFPHCVGEGTARQTFPPTNPGERSLMEVSARIHAPPTSVASSRRGGSLVVRLLPSARPASHVVSTKIRANAINNLQRSKIHLESLFCYDKSVPEENIGKPTGLDLEKRNVGKNPPCLSCEAKGAVLCATCAGSGLYVDSILESQGIIVKVRCLGCGGTGNIMCSKCGGRGHT